MLHGAGMFTNMCPQITQFCIYKDIPSMKQHGVKPTITELVLKQKITKNHHMKPIESSWNPILDIETHWNISFETYWNLLNPLETSWNPGVTEGLPECLVTPHEVSPSIIRDDGVLHSMLGLGKCYDNAEILPDFMGNHRKSNYAKNGMIIHIVYWDQSSSAA